MDAARSGLRGCGASTSYGLLGERGLILRQGTRVDATRMAAPSSTNNAKGERDPQMRSTKKGKPWYLGMKAPMGVDTAHGLVHTVVGTAAKVPDVKLTAPLLHGEEQQVHGDKGGSATAWRVIRPALRWWCFPFKRVRAGNGPRTRTRSIIACPRLGHAWSTRFGSSSASLDIPRGATPWAVNRPESFKRTGNPDPN